MRCSQPFNRLKRPNSFSLSSQRRISTRLFIFMTPFWTLSSLCLFFFFFFNCVGENVWNPFSFYTHTAVLKYSYKLHEAVPTALRFPQRSFFCFTVLFFYLLTEGHIGKSFSGSQQTAPVPQRCTNRRYIYPTSRYTLQQPHQYICYSSKVPACQCCQPPALCLLQEFIDKLFHIYKTTFNFWPE